MTSFPRDVLALALALLSGCQNEIWLSELDGHVGHDASHDASVIDGGVTDAELDAAIGRECERSQVPVVMVADTTPLETPTFAVSGRLTTLRYAVLVPPAASLTATDDTRLVVLDDRGALLHERTLHLDDASGATLSTATLHSLSSLSDEEGFLLLTPRAIWMLDADGAGSEATALTTAPSSTWQRRAGWIDADRFAFVSDTADGRIAVFDVRTREVTTTAISTAGAMGVHLEPGGATLSGVGPNEIVVYDPDLSGTETLRQTWEDGSPLGTRLLGVGLFGAERTWLVHTPSEFRADITGYRVAPGETPIAGTAMTRLGPFTASREGPFLAITTQNPTVVLYAFEAHTFSIVAMDFEGAPIVEHERDGASVAILFTEPVVMGRSLELACGRR